MRVRIILFVLLITLFSSLAYASCVDSGISDNFDYGTSFASNGWTYYAGGCVTSCELNYPLLSPFGTNAFAYDTSLGCVPCPATHTRYIQRSLGFNYTTQIIEIGFIFGYYNDTDVLSSPFYIQLGDSSKTLMSIYPSHTILGNTNFLVYNSSGSGGGSVVECNYTSMSSLFPPPTDIRFYLTLDMVRNKFSIYLNDTLICDDSTSYSNYAINTIKLAEAIDASEGASFYLDNFYICSSSGIVLGELGSPCTLNEECLTGKCEYRQCVKKQGSEGCTDSSQCVSNQCIGGLCKKPSFSENMEESKTEWFGTDQTSSNWVSVIIMVGSAIAVVGGTGGGGIGILIALAVFYVEGFFFAYIGWLSAFILIALIVVALIIVVFAFLIKGN